MNLPPPITATKTKRPASRWPAALVAALLGGAGGFTAGEEDIVFQSYADPVWGWAVPTACAGDTGQDIRRDMTFTLEECLAKLDARHVKTWNALAPSIVGEITLGGALALTSLADNVGVGAVKGSTMVKLINAGADESVWCRQFTEAKARYTPIEMPLGDGKQNSVLAPIGWVVAGGRSCRESRACRGIVGRREREQAMCLRDVAVPPEFQTLLEQTP